MVVILGIRIGRDELEVEELVDVNEDEGQCPVGAWMSHFVAEQAPIALLRFTELAPPHIQHLAVQASKIFEMMEAEYRERYIDTGITAGLTWAKVHDAVSEAFPEAACTRERPQADPKDSRFSA